MHVSALVLAALAALSAAVGPAAGPAAGPDAKPAPPDVVCYTLVDAAAPAYPADAAASGAQGESVVLLAVAPDGSVADAKAETSAAPFDEAAIAAARRFRFAAAAHGKKLPQAARVVFRFRAGDGLVALSLEKKLLVVTVPSRVSSEDVVDVGRVLGYMAEERPQPPFPDGVGRIETQIAVDVRTDASGRVASATGGKGPDPYRATAEAYARHWTFRALRLNGKPVTLRGELVFNWRPA